MTIASPTSSSTMNVPTFVEVLKRSNLVEQDRLQRSLQSVALSTDHDGRTAEEVAEHLITAGLITKWQSQQLLKGKYRGFFLGKYVIRQPLGKGGMAVVYEGEHSVLNTRVAIKVLPKARNNVEKSVSRFLAEARAAAKLNHPNIVRVHDCDVVDNRRFMVMEMVEGSDLGSIVEKKGPLRYGTALTLIKQAASGLGYAHEQGVTHRDVKPHNFLIDSEGTLKVTDMGLALFDIDAPDRHTKEGGTAILGTVDYIAPEQAWDSRKVDRRADIYSLGCTLYFLLTGRGPFAKGTLAQRLAKHQTASPTPIPQIRPDCPPAIWQLCSRMMAKKPGDRPQKMREVVAACEAILPTLSHGGQSAVKLAETARELDPFNSSLDSYGSSGDSGLPDFTASMELISSDPNLGMATGSPVAGGAAPAQGDFWNAPVATKKATRSKSQSDDLVFDGMMSSHVAIALGIFLALGGLAISVVVALNSGGDERQSIKPYIKSVEKSDGEELLIIGNDG